MEFNQIWQKKRERVTADTYARRCKALAQSPYGGECSTPAMSYPVRTTNLPEIAIGLETVKQMFATSWREFLRVWDQFGYLYVSRKKMHDLVSKFYVLFKALQELGILDPNLPKPRGFNTVELDSEIEKPRNSVDLFSHTSNQHWRGMNLMGASPIVLLLTKKRGFRRDNVQISTLKKKLDRAHARLWEEISRAQWEEASLVSEILPCQAAVRFIDNLPGVMEHHRSSTALYNFKGVKGFRNMRLSVVMGKQHKKQEFKLLMMGSKNLSGGVSEPSLEKVFPEDRVIKGEPVFINVDDLSDDFSTLYWNVKGCEREGFHRVIKRMIETTAAKIVVLTSTRTQAERLQLMLQGEGFHGFKNIDTEMEHGGAIIAWNKHGVEENSFHGFLECSHHNFFLSRSTNLQIDHEEVPQTLNLFPLASGF